MSEGSTPGVGGTGPGAAASDRLTIGKVLAALADDFPDVSASKIRFLEAEGLVTPQRTASGYRTFSQADVQRLRYILQAQRDRFWPLKVIGEALDALDRGLTDDPGPVTSPDSPGAPGSAATTRPGRPRPPSPRPDPEVPSPRSLLERHTVSLTGAEVREATGLDPETFVALETYGLLQSDAHGHYGEDALAVAGAARALAAHGLEARHLRPFRTAADREIGLAEQVLATRHGGGTREERAAEIVSACLALHVALVRSGLSR
ncbi:transcriptional regulator FtsR [Humibacillus xanthopallidus]|uniref:MerR-like DNA binding protein n=1 Tax=Humibacillus xanthopallidus TaxID=412689 RepID=A0A543HIB7_9MICO|nr:MerR family transcriptional regulator [Humibacillus xanthopallidus]TQM58071.1 MerR-like DNA binding protein [Humibacillus xanthopallidus]